MSVARPTALERLEAEIASRDQGRCDLTLYVSGASPLSARAIQNARELFEVRLKGQCRLSVVDVSEDATARFEHPVLATPSLVRTWPLPVRTLVGDLSQPARVLWALGLSALETSPGHG